MSYLLKVATIDIILSLHRRGWSQRRIARELNVNRETVARHLKHAKSAAELANAPTGSDTPDPASKPANAPTGSDDPETQPIASDQPHGSPPITVASRKSECEPWRKVIQSKCDLGLSAQRIYQDLTTEYNFTGSYYSVRRFVGRLEPTRELPFRRLECGPGEEAQVDFGTGAPIIGPDGKRRKTHVFRIVLSHSRKAYSEAVYRQTTDDFLRCLESAFRHFGGAPKCLVLDNLLRRGEKGRLVRARAQPQGPVLWSALWLRILAHAALYTASQGKSRKRCRLRSGQCAQREGFTSLQEENRFLLDWELTVADTRIHGTTRRQVGKHFAEVERGALLPLPLEPFPSFHEGRRIVHRDGHVEVDRAYYAVPPEYSAREVWVRWDGRLVRIFNERMQPIAVHTKHEPGRFSTPPQFIASQKISTVERGAAWLLDKVITRLGPHSATWAKAMIQARGIEGVRVLQGLLSLASRQPASAIERACEVATSYGAYHLRTIRMLIKRQAPKQEVMEFMTEHPMIRPMSEYGQFVHDAFQFRNSQQ